MENKSSPKIPRFSVMYNYVRSRQLEGTFPGDATTGTWITTGMRVGKGWGWIEESLWPYDGNANHWPPSEPAGLDIRAKENRTLVYQRINTVDECRIVLASGNVVSAGFLIDDSWFNAINGIISIPSNQSITNSHAILLCGYNDKKRLFTFQNSWGVSWGDDGYGYLPYEYFPDRFREGYSIADKGKRPPFEKSTGIVLLSWGIEGLLGNKIHGQEFVDLSQNEIIAWAFSIEHEDFLDIEELYVRPTWRNQGYALKLAANLYRQSAKVGKPLRAWIPHSDYIISNHKPLKTIICKLGLSLNPSPVKWASKVGL